MKFIIVFAALFAVALAAPASKDDVQIVRLDSDVQPNGYNFALETSDGTSRQEQGALKYAGTDEEAIAVKGSFSWVAADGQIYKVDFVADENGYQPQGAHLPVAPVA